MPKEVSCERNGPIGKRDPVNIEERHSIEEKVDERVGVAQIGRISRRS